MISRSVQTPGEWQHACQVLCFSWVHLDSASHDSSFCQFLRTDVTLSLLYIERLCVWCWKAPPFGMVCNLFTKSSATNDHKWKTSAWQWSVITAVQWSRQWSHFRGPHLLTLWLSWLRTPSFPELRSATLNVVWPHGGKRGNWRSCTRTHTHTHTDSLNLCSLSLSRKTVFYWKRRKQSKSRKGRSKNRWGVPFKSGDWWVSAWAQCNTTSPDWWTVMCWSDQDRDVLNL